ncbi:MAG: 50S ribosomal protein L10 [Bacteroidetes bacterium]|nr:50S ribosomal protein L10 [Bacteroidota bacterium]
MKREEKEEIISSLVENLSKYNNFYIADISNLTVEKTNKFRRICFNQNIKVSVAKNTLIQKALEKMDGDYSPLFDALKGSSAIMYSDTGNAPAKVIKDFRKTSDRPILKGAWIDSAIFVGDNYLDALVSLKSKNELIGDIIALLQSPAKNVIAGLQSGGQKLSGILKTLENKGS